MTHERRKHQIVNGGMRDAWLGAGLEVPAAKYDPGAKARRESDESERRKAAAEAKRARRAGWNR